MSWKMLKAEIEFSSVDCSLRTHHAIPLNSPCWLFYGRLSCWKKAKTLSFKLQYAKPQWFLLLSFSNTVFIFGIQSKPFLCHALTLKSCGSSHVILIFVSLSAPGRQNLTKGPSSFFSKKKKKKGIEQCLWGTDKHSSESVINILAKGSV